MQEEFSALSLSAWKQGINFPCDSIPSPVPRIGEDSYHQIWRVGTEVSLHK